MTEKMVTVTEAEWNDSQRVRNIVGKVMQNKKARAMVEKAYKLVEPNAATPTADELETEVAPVAALEQKFDKFVADETARREKEDGDRKLADFTKRVNDETTQLRERGYSDEGLAEVKKIMEAKGLTPLDAAAIFERDNPPQSVVTPTSRSGAWNFMDQPTEGGDENIKRLIASKGDNEAVLSNMVNAALTDVRGPSPLRR